MPGLADCPRITVDLIDSEAESFDPGEIGVPAVAPALAAAIHSATGLRLRSLPFDLGRAMAAAPPVAPATGESTGETSGATPDDAGEQSLPSAEALDSQQPDAGASDQ